MSSADLISSIYDLSDKFDAQHVFIHCKFIINSLESGSFTHDNHKSTAEVAGPGFRIFFNFLENTISPSYNEHQPIVLDSEYKFCEIMSEIWTFTTDHFPNIPMIILESAALSADRFAMIKPEWINQYAEKNSLHPILMNSVDYGHAANWSMTQNVIDKFTASKATWSVLDDKTAQNTSFSTIQ